MSTNVDQNCKSWFDPMPFCCRLQKNCKNLYTSCILFIDKLRAGRFLSSCNTAPWSSWLVTRPFQGCNAGSIPAGAIFLIISGMSTDIDMVNYCQQTLKAGSIPARKNQSLQLLQCGRFHVVK